MVKNNEGVFYIAGVRAYLPLAMRRIASLAVAISAGLASAQDTIKIGVPAPLSGSYQHAGMDIVDGGRLAVDQINAAGGELGKKFELVPQDDACDPDGAARAATQLIAAGVVAVAGGYCSSAALPELRVLHDRHIPYVLDASTFPQLTEHGWSDVFRTIGRGDAQGRFAAQFMKDVLHATRAAVIDDGSTYSHGLARSTIAALRQAGVEVVYDRAITPAQPDYRDVVKAATDAKADVLYFTGYYTDAAVLAKNRRELTPAIKYFMGNGTADPSLIEKGGEAVEGMMVTTSPLPQFFAQSRARRSITRRSPRATR